MRYYHYHGETAYCGTDIDEYLALPDDEELDIEEASANSVPAAAVIRKMRALSGFIGFKGSVGGMCKSAVKVCGSTVKLQLKLPFLSVRRDVGIRGVAVKCLDITKNSDREGRCPEHN